MTRAARLLDLIEFLRGQDATSVGHIAEALAVSRRTVFRDIALLRERGWPIAADPGPGGGVRLERQRGVAAVHLSPDEVVTLWIAAQLSTRVSALPWGAAARSALTKVLASLNQERARELRRLVKRVVVGRPASARVREQLQEAPAELLTAFERCFTRSLCLGFDYTDRHGRQTRRRIEPHGLLVETPAWYILARDLAINEPRMFRMDRVRNARVLTDRSFVPDFEGLRQQYLARRAER